MTPTSAGLKNTYHLGEGVTRNFAITYNDALSTVDGQDRANALMESVEGDYAQMSYFFGGVSIPFTLPISVYLTTGAFAQASWVPPTTLPLLSSPLQPATITLQPGDGQPAALCRYLLVSEVTEMLMSSMQNGWGYSFGDSNEGNKGEALSCFLGYHFMSHNGLDTSVLTQGDQTFFVANQWLSTSPRMDYVSDNPYNPDNSDNKHDARTGCATLFLYYLFTQLQFAIPQIINAGAVTLAGVYSNLTGDLGNPFPFFSRLLGNAFPDKSTITSGPNFDNPFPLGLLSFWVDKNTFGRDEVQDIIDIQSGLISNAFWLVLEGFSVNSFNALNIAIPTPTGSFLGLGGVSILNTPATAGGNAPGSPIAQFEDPSSLTVPQRIRFSFDIKFTNLSAFPKSGGNPVLGELDAKATVGGDNLPGATAATLFELLGGADPYFTNIDPSSGADIFYLSQDLRVFSLAAGTAPLPGAPAFTTDPYGSIQSLLGFLNGSNTYMVPTSNDPLNSLPGQTGFETADSSVSPVNAAGLQKYNFALARVRFRGAAGSSASKVRVFFRLFVAQSCDTDFQPSTTYKSTLGTTGADLNHPVFPLPSGTGLTDPTSQAVQTIPFFATGTAGTHDYDSTVSNANVRTITIPAGADAVWVYYGCFLDIYNPNNQSKFAGTHHCIVAEIASDDAPIPTTTPAGTTPSPANWDKLAQRNLQITNSENPQTPATKIIPQAFDLRPSRTLMTSLPGTLLDLPDELMIDWGNTPTGATATVYWPQLNAKDVLALANQIYASHLLIVVDANTLQCTVTKGVTYIPIPPATGINFAGLFTVDLPTAIRSTQVFDIVLRRISTRRITVDRPPRIAAKFITTMSGSTRSTLSTSVQRQSITTSSIITSPNRDGHQIRNWRQISGAFQVRIPVVTAAVMLKPEEDTLAILKWRLLEMSPVNRWYKVLQRYVSIIEERVNGLGGFTGSIPPSLSGAPPIEGGCGKTGRGGEKGCIGKVIGVCYDHCGEFEGFTLCLDSGTKCYFCSRKPKVENLVRCAWKECWEVEVQTRCEHGHHGHHGETPCAIILRHA